MTREKIYLFDTTLRARVARSGEAARARRQENQPSRQGMRHV